jgi:hypothetical protein
MEDVIEAPNQVTPEWLTRVLLKSGFLRSGKVIHLEKTLTKTLTLSVVSRFEVRYSEGAAGFPPTKLFLKLSRPDLLKSFSSELNGKEVEFYKIVAPEMNDPPFINCFSAAFSSESGKSHLLLEDLTETHFQPLSPYPPSKSYCELAMDCMSRLHAHWWEHPRLGKEIGALFDRAQLNAFVAELEKNVLNFVHFLRDGLAAERRKIYDQLLSSSYKIWGRLTERTGLTLTHGDAHWWNLLYPRETKTHGVRLFDWHLWHVDVGARDLAFMVALGGYAERQAALEQSLIRRYYESLVAHGVTNYSWNDCWDDYRWSAIRNLNIPIIQWIQGKSTEEWRRNLERAMDAYEDLRCFELLNK